MRIQVVTAKRLWETECLAFLNQRERIDATGKHTYKYSPNPQCAKVLWTWTDCILTAFTKIGSVL